MEALFFPGSCNDGNLWVFFFLFLQQRMCSISGSNYLQGAFQEGDNLSFHLQLIRDQMRWGGGVMEEVAQQVC